MKRRKFAICDVKGCSVKYNRFNKEYRTWCRIIAKCTNPNHHRYPIYGGKGLTVDPLFRYSFLNFINEIGECPEPKMEYSIERINNDIGYMSGNIKWIKTTEQNLNKTNNIMVMCDNVQMPLATACRKLGINVDTVYSRICRGFSIEEALTASKIKRKPRLIYDNGEPIRLWAFIKKYGLNRHYVYKMAKQGMSGDDILICPQAYSASRSCGNTLEYMGMSMTRQGWAKYLNISSTTLRDRLEKGYSIGFICDMYLGRSKE